MNKLLRLLWLIVNLAIVYTSAAQSYIQEWSVQLGGEGWDLINATALDEDGNIYLGGRISGSVTLGNNHVSANKDNEFILCKINNSGAIVKTRLISGGIYNRLNSILCDDNLVYLTGTFRDSLLISPLSANNSNNTSLFIARLNKDLEPERINAPVTGAEIKIGSCENDMEGNIFISGYFKNWISVEDSIIHSTYRKELFVLKVNLEGNVVWINTWPTRNIKYLPAIRITNRNELIVCGTFDKKLDYADTTIFSNGETDIFIEHFDSNGKTLWVKTFGGSREDIGGPITTDTIGNIYASGVFYNTITIEDTSYISSGESDLIILKLNPLGNIIWSNQLSGSRSENFGGLATDQKGNLFSIINFKGSMIFEQDTIPCFDRRSDILFLKLNSSGEYMWSKRFFGNSEDLGRSVINDYSDNIFINGSFSSNLEMDQKSFTSKGITDIFIAKYFDPCTLETFTLPDIWILCENEVDTLDAGEGFLEYTWEGIGSGSRYLEVSEPDYYTATVIDQYGCLKSDSILVKLDSIRIKYHVTDEFLPEGNNGSIQTTIEGISNQYMYLWNTGDTTPDLTGLSQGLYNLFVRDEYNCFSTIEISVGLDISSGILSLTNFPNPFNEITNIIYSIPKNVQVDISLFDMNGKKLFNILHIEQETGEHQFEWNRMDLPSGVYYLQIKTADGMISRKILITDL